MGGWTALALPRVSQPAIAAGLATQGASWESVAHVTATTTLASAVRNTDSVCLPLATLLDLVVLPGMPGEMALSVDGFPGPHAPNSDAYLQQLSKWQDQSTGRRLRIGIQSDDSLRAFVREHSNDPSAHALLASRREYSRTVHTLVASGVDPRDVQPNDALGRLAVQAWTRGEQEVPALGAPRDLLWLDFQGLPDQNPQAAALTQRVRDALGAAYGSAERWTIAHHGFYFYTPPQWALFQIMRRMPEVDQIFIVHDDGENPAFATWRHYFRTDLSMPVPVPVPHAHSPGEVITPAATALRAALTGRPVRNVPNLAVMECRSPAELARLWRDEDHAEAGAPDRYAAHAKDVERFVQRLGHGAGRAAPRLSELPVGSFLMALHRCVHQAPDGSISVRLDGDSLMDMVASGFLDWPADEEPIATPVLRRALPYFAGCQSAHEWRERGAQLLRMIEERVSPLGGRDHAQSDVERIALAAANPTRLVPWADLSIDQAKAVTKAVRRVLQLVDETSRHERVVLRDQLNRIRERLERSLKALSAEERAAVEDKVRGFAVALNDEIDVGGLVDVVAMLLGRKADIDVRDSNESPDSTSVTEMRGLDALGLSRSSSNLHVTNLAADTYPSRVPVVGWPFTLPDLRHSVESGVEPITVELFEIRSATAALGDLYLFWLGLDGVDASRALTLSWVSDQAGERRPLSPIASLLTSPEVRSSAVREAAGGLSLEKVRSAADLPADTMRIDPSGSQFVDDDIEAALNALDPRASASALACPRRLALQWCVGPTHAFGPEHLQSMLFGNVTSALVRTKLDNAFGARATTNTVWAHLTEGQRASSLDKAVIGASPWPRSADPAWLQSLFGGKDGTSRLDRFYQAAKKHLPAKAEDAVPPDTGFLPRGVDDPEVCGRCPVQARCQQWVEKDR